MTFEIIFLLSYVAVGLFLGIVSLPWKSTSNRRLDQEDWSTLLHLLAGISFWPYLVIGLPIMWVWKEYPKKWYSYLNENERFKRAQAEYLNSTNTFL